MQHLFDLTRMKNHDFLKMLEIIGLKTTEHALKQPKVQALIHAEHTEGVFDLLLAEQFYQEAFLALAHKYRVPIVTTSTLGYENHMSQMMGLITPWSFVPHGFMPFTDRMSFMERVKNSYESLYEDLDRYFNYFPKMDAITEQYFGKVLGESARASCFPLGVATNSQGVLAAEVPKVWQMERQISVMLLNSHAPLTTARPTVDAMVPVGGMHIYPPKALPQDMQSFLDAATDGAIFFSLGMCAQMRPVRRCVLTHLSIALSLPHRQQCAEQGNAARHAAPLSARLWLAEAACAMEIRGRIDWPTAA